MPGVYCFKNEHLAFIADQPPIQAVPNNVPWNEAVQMEFSWILFDFGNFQVQNHQAYSSSMV